MIYLETSSLVAYTLTRVREPARYQEMAQLINKINGGEIEAITSFYALLELYMVAMNNAVDARQGTRDGKAVILEILRTNVDLVPLLRREERLVHTRRFAALRDSDDIPHAITAYLHGCQVLITYDTHFQTTANLIPYQSPSEFLATFTP